MAFYQVRSPATAVASPLLVHIPHSATAVPSPWRSDIILSASELERELLAMTDHFTDELFAPAALAQGGIAFVNNLSRLVFDPERFEDDSAEPMSRKGMGAVYTRTATGAPLRSASFSAADRETTLAELFRPYAAALEQQVADQLDCFDRCLIIDAHSFPARALPYEDEALDRPDICLGYDDYHGPASLIDALEQVATRAGWRVGRNTPFAGSYVPLAYSGRDRRVASVMIELNRGRYLDESQGGRAAGFEDTRELASQLVETAVLFEAFRHTSFHVATGAADFCIRIGEQSAALDALLVERGHECWAYVTAFNPNGKPAPESANESAQERLKRELRERRLVFFSGEGRADVGDWPAEPSVLVLGIGEEAALELGKRLGQAAIVLGSRGQPARLVGSA